MKLFRLLRRRSPSPSLRSGSGSRLLAMTVQVIMDLVFPQVCPLCEKESLQHPRPACPHCEKQLLKEPDLTSISTDTLSCRPYKNLMKKCIKEFKYGKNKRMLLIFSRIIENYLKKYPLIRDKIDLIIPVPASKKRYKQRGFNQSKLISEILAETLGIPASDQILMKTRETGSQTSLTRKERLKNLQGSFSIKNTETLKDKNILLVDDVITTGATLETCSKELIKTGVKKIVAFTLAKTL